MRCLTSPYILFSFWAKTKTAKWTWPVPSAHPWAFGKNIGIGFGVGKHFCSVVWSLDIAWGKSPPKIHLDSGSPSKSPTYSNENLPAWTTRKIFHNPRPKNKIPSAHPAQGVQRDGRRPFAVLYDSLNHIIFLNRSFRSSTLASFGLPGAHASACADSARN